MSVVGIDFGNDNCIVAQAKRGGIDVVLNENSNRKNPTIISLQNKQRFIGEQAASMVRSNIKNTITNVKRLMGRKFAEPEVQEEISHLGYKVEAGEGGENVFKVNYQDEVTTLSTEQAAGMMFSKLKSIAEAANGGATVADTVISVPGYYTDAQRRSLLAGAQIAGLNVLRAMNEHTAVALAYGIWKSARNMFHESEPQKVMFIDMGHSAFTVSVVFFVQGRLQVKSAVFDRNLGGRNFDRVIVQDMAEAFKEKHKMDPTESKKGVVKMMAAAEKAKKTLSPAGVNEARVVVECLVDEIDLNYTLPVAKFDELIEPLLERMAGPVARAMEEAGVEASELACIEIVGGGTRVSAVKQRLATILGLDATKTNYGLSTTLNADESVARGAALQCAILSPLFKVKDFALSDTVAFPVRLCWEAEAGVEAAAAEPMETEEGEEGEAEAAEGANTVVIFQRNDETPKIRRVTFKRTGTFEVNAVYDDAAAPLLPEGCDTQVGRFVVSGVAPKDGQMARIRVNVKHDIHGIFSVSSAQMMEEIEEEKKEEVEGEGKEAEGKADEGKEAEGKADEGKEGEGKAEEAPKKKRFRKVELRIEGFTSAMSRDALNAAVEVEANMSQQDRIIQETADKRNELESFIYDMRDRVLDGGELRPFLDDAAAEGVTNGLQEAEDWLYSDEGFDSTKSVYADRLKVLVEACQPAQRRKTESELRAAVTAELLAAAETYKKTVMATGDSHAHLTDEERQTVKDECSSTETWLYDQMALQNDLSMSVDPVLTVDAVRSRKNTLANICRPIINKPKPKPKPEEKKEEEVVAPEGEGKEAEGEEGADKVDGEGDVEMEGEPSKPEGAAADAATAPETMELD